jgi:hypothetical protein
VLGGCGSEEEQGVFFVVDFTTKANRLIAGNIEEDLA